MKKIAMVASAAALALALALSGCSTNSPGAGSTPGGASNPAGSGASGSGTPAASTPTVTLKMGTKMSEESLEGKGFQKFADLVEEKTNGAVQVVVYPSEQLGDATTQINNLAMGTQQLYAESGNYFSGYTNMFEITNIPYLFQSNEQYIELVQGDFGKKQEEVLEENGFKIMGHNRDWVRGPYRVICSTYPIKTMEDIKGLRFRTHESDLYMKCWSTLGANPIVINWTETYLAISQGTAQAVASPVSMIEDMGFYEVAPYITDISEYPQEILVVMNKAVFDSLTPEQQEACMEAADEAAAWSNEQLEGEVEASIQRMEEAGATFYKMDTTPCTEALLGYFRELESAGTIPAGLLETLGY